MHSWGMRKRERRSQSNQRGNLAIWVLNTDSWISPLRNPEECDCSHLVKPYRSSRQRGEFSRLPSPYRTTFPTGEIISARCGSVKTGQSPLWWLQVMEKRPSRVPSTWRRTEEYGKLAQPSCFTLRSLVCCCFIIKSSLIDEISVGPVCCSSLTSRPALVWVVSVASKGIYIVIT